MRIDMTPLQEWLNAERGRSQLLHDRSGVDKCSIAKYKSGKAKPSAIASMKIELAFPELCALDNCKHEDAYIITAWLHSPSKS